ncbi:hypothetical protein BC835DRAFT_1303210 [Cytidiella melzeri]|nr:hypothetical protein BC835DRAFT_1303210 [Cytidiella melzeri]
MAGSSLALYAFNATLRATREKQEQGLKEGTDVNLCEDARWRSFWCTVANNLKGDSESTTKPAISGLLPQLETVTRDSAEFEPVTQLSCVQASEGRAKENRYLFSNHSSDQLSSPKDQTKTRPINSRFCVLERIRIRTAGKHNSYKDNFLEGRVVDGNGGDCVGGLHDEG